ncbi:hypothetical protein [Maricaulis salignorans]|uniref:Uncharacterized protein n=1 Tax=Maricaulis salignorans TaxID=144026 RepID=A0A1G9UTJ4_9PROT|nr:hypothetical protein [Maricaulis salignorans]SDM63189.1 hypothetical protein SAMN04488568_11657 [Maricaulis salignorans]
MALLVPIVLVLILVFLALRYRSRDSGLKACLWRIEQSLADTPEHGETMGLAQADADALREAPEHLFRLVISAMEDGTPRTRAQTLTAIREYREFRGWKV